MTCWQCKREPHAEGFTIGEKCIRSAMGSAVGKELWRKVKRERRQVRPQVSCG